MFKSDNIDGNSIFKAGVRVVWYGFVLLAGIGFGCQYQGIHPAEKDISPLVQARQTFLQGDYPLAGEKFDVLVKQAVDPEIINSSLHGLACVDMITADDADTFLKALESLLHHQIQTEGVPLENYELLIRALGHGSRLMGNEYRQTLDRIDELKTTNRKQNREILKLQKQIKTLQHQISSLESIDQELQEKRKNQ
ncbi:MAG: DUF3450 domain-containing protein [Desulfobacteraceae bacterium]|nr:DUF3450 domain-containing protein [Desulfobacteraceae bacterium]